MHSEELILELMLRGVLQTWGRERFVSDVCDTWGSSQLPHCSSNRRCVPVPPSCHPWGHPTGLYHGATRDHGVQQSLVFISGAPRGERGWVFMKCFPPCMGQAPCQPFAGQLGDGTGLLEGPGGALGSVLGTLVKACF